VIERVSVLIRFLPIFNEDGWIATSATAFCY